MAKKFRYGSQESSVERGKSGEWSSPEIEGAPVSISNLAGGALRARTNASESEAYAVAGEDLVWVHVNGRSFALEPVKKSRRRGKAPGGGLTAPMPGQIMRHLVEPGESVEEGQALLVMEAMKMQLEIKAPHNGTLKKFLAEPGETVPAGVTLVEVEPE